MGIFSFFSKEKKEKLDQGLEKTKTSLFEKISKALVGKSSVDDDFLDKLEEIHLPKMKHVLTKFGILDNESLMCPFCNVYEGKNKASTR
jgi:fused signal recognition particle receptor